tara:strand:+ start:71 stop:859 length:789 start_codon:yes stop_codon:yes gene_type:complete
MFTLNGKPVVFGKFPNGEMNLDIQLMDKQHHNGISWHYEGDHEIFQLQVLKSYLDSQDTVSRLYIGYLPFSRMDRNNGFYAVTLKSITKIINDLNFYKVTVREPHSDVSMILLERAFQHDWVIEQLCRFNVDKFDSVCFPDAGAMKRYNAEELSKPYSCGEKVRDFESGGIKSLQIVGDVRSKVLIVDDLCSRGGTFIKTAIELKKRGATSVSLLVAHCEPNVFTGDMFDHINMLYTSPEMLKGDTGDIYEHTKQITFLENN